MHTHFAGVDDRDAPESLEEIKGMELYRFHAVYRVVCCSTTQFIQCVYIV